MKLANVCQQRGARMEVWDAVNVEEEEAGKISCPHLFLPASLALTSPPRLLPRDLSGSCIMQSQK